MNEITRIHIAKTAYDIEIAAKKQLEKYIKSLEVYTKDAEVLEDIEIRITELLAERKVAPGGVINTEDVKAVRKQLGEPYEFADGEGDMAVGPEVVDSGRRLYRSTDNAVLGGILSGVATYFNVNPLWTRLIFILLMFISFGTAIFVYILLWVLIPPARTATEKLQLAGKEVNVASIQALNADEDTATPNRVAPVLQTFFSISLGLLSGLAAAGVAITAFVIALGATTYNTSIADAANRFIGLGPEYSWLAWLLFWIGIFGLALLAALFGLISYAFFAKKVTKKMIISSIIIIALGLLSVATVVGVGSTQSVRVANETRAMVRETTTNLPQNFNNVKTAQIKVVSEETNAQERIILSYPTIRYVVDNSQPRYVFSGLRTTKVNVAIEGETAKISLTMPNSFRNSFVQPVLTIYGPALSTFTADGEASEVSYIGGSQDLPLRIESANSGLNVNANGTFARLTVGAVGSVDLSESVISTLEVDSKQGVNVTAGTVRDLLVKLPDVCAGFSSSYSSSVTVAGVTSGKITFNGQERPVETYRTNCAAVIIDNDNQSYDEY